MLALWCSDVSRILRVKDLSRGMPLPAKAHLEPRVDSWRAGEALLQPLTRPARIDGPAEAETSDDGGVRGRVMCSHSLR